MELAKQWLCGCFEKSGITHKLTLNKKSPSKLCVGLFYTQQYSFTELATTFFRLSWWAETTA